MRKLVKPARATTIDKALWPLRCLVALGGWDKNVTPEKVISHLIPLFEKLEIWSLQKIDETERKYGFDYPKVRALKLLYIVAQRTFPLLYSVLDHINEAQEKEANGNAIRSDANNSN